MSERSSWFDEIFIDCDSRARVNPPVAPDLPWESDPMFFAGEISVNTARLCQQVLDADVLSNIAGVDSQKALQLVTPSVDGANVTVNRLEKRRAYIAGLIDDLKAKPLFRRIRHNERWDRLQTNCTQYLADVCHEPVCEGVR